MRRITAQDLDAELYDLIFGEESSFLRRTGDRGEPKRIISKRERQLREQAEGRSRDVFRGASTIFVPGASEFLSKLFDKKFNEQEKEQAKEQLKSEFNVDIEKENKPKNPMAQFAKKFSKSLKRIEEAINGVKAAVDSINDNITTNLVDRIIRSNKSMSDALMVIAGVKNPMTDLKPETLEMNNQEYLYYKTAPEGRQFYQKSAKGTAGRIASKKEQKSLMNIVNRVVRKKKTTLNKAIDDATMTMAKDYVTKKDLEKLVQEINNKTEAATTQLTDMEQKTMLREALQEALQKIIEKNPNLLKCQSDGGGILPIPIGGGKIASRIGNAVRAGYAAVASGASSVVAGLKSALGGGALGSAAVAGGGALAITGGGLLAMDASMRGRADETILKIAETGSVSDIRTMLESGTPQQRAYKLQQIRMIAQEKPDLVSKINEGINSAKLTDVTPQQLLDPATMAPAQQLLDPATMAPAQQTLIPYQRAPADAAAQNIINQNRINRDTQRISTMINNSQTPVVNNITNNNVAPQTMFMDNQKNKYANQDSTFNRLVAQDFDNPYSDPVFGY